MVANALVPFDPHAADVYLVENKSTILRIAQELLKLVVFVPTTIYRGIILRTPATLIVPHKNLQYLSFSTERSIAEHFADVNGFGSTIMDVEAQLGKYGYVIEYEPKVSEILFHFGFLSLLPYADAFSLMDMDGSSEVESLKLQKEIIILQPSHPFTNIRRI